MITKETKELKISDELKRKVEMICKFANVKYTFVNGKPHILKVYDNDY